MISLVVLAGRGFLDSVPAPIGEYLLPGFIVGGVLVYCLYMVLKLTGKIDF